MFKKISIYLLLGIGFIPNFVFAQSLLDFKPVISRPNTTVEKIKPITRPQYNETEMQILMSIQKRKNVQEKTESEVEVKDGENIYKLETLSIQEIIPDNIKIEREFRKYIKNILKQYTTDQTLDADIIDNRDPIVRNFITSTSATQKHGALSIVYYPDLLFNKKSTSFCFISYDPQQNLIETYINSKLFSKEEAIEYLSYHEMAHCLLFNKKVSSDSKTNELLADSFVITHYLNSNNYKMAQKVLDYVKLPKKEHIHENYPEIAKYAVLLNKDKKDKNIKFKNIDEIITRLVSDFKIESNTNTHIANNSTDSNRSPN